MKSRFKKEIVRAGRYSAARKDGRVSKEFTPEDIHAYANTGNRLVAAGYKIPAPFNHSPAALPVIDEPTQADAFNNAGYWDRFYVENVNGAPTLFAELEAFGDKNDINTPAGKIATTVKEVSISALDEWTDGLNNKWDHVPLHIALCTNPVMPNQQNFELVDNAVAFSMSMALSDDSGINELRDALAEESIYLPQGVDRTNLVQMLTVSLKQKAMCKLNADDDEAFVPQIPILFSSTGESEMNEAQAKAIVETKAVNPATNKPFTMEDLGFKAVAAPAPATPAPKTEDNSALVALVNKLAGNLATSKVADVARRAKELVSSGRITQAVYDSVIAPKIASFNMSSTDVSSLIDNNVKTPLEVVIESFEALPVPAKTPASAFNFSIPTDDSHVPLPSDAADLSPDEEKNLSSLLLSVMNQ